ncbi:YecA family protein [Planococcus lenghuensis]|uniref:Zinc chelation protein SecC n=1 Tax=Planococcus lenghuensis TaxID=2213202 RepID=A0A1Q2KVL8_9BACL|nr:SEC-C metal-binding domain-containing protein [Planococcus lenghuensis]AQQ52265.1 hypothetical protein B0X71_03480 [Planococcus lenghuensis]
MDILNRLDPYLTTEDKNLRNFALHILENLPSIKPEWPDRLIRAAIDDPGFSARYLVALANSPVDSAEVPAFKEAVSKLQKTKLFPLRNLVKNLPLAVLVENSKEFSSLFTKEEWAFLVKLSEASKQKTDEMLMETLEKLDASPEYRPDLFDRAKTISRRQVEQDWIDRDILRQSFDLQMQAPYFDFTGIITVYRIKLLKDESFIADLAPLLARDEDILLEEVADALVAFQSDEVIRAIEPFTRIEYPIFTYDVMAQTFSPFAIETMKKHYWSIDDLEMKSVIIKGLTEQLASEGREEIEHFMTFVAKPRIYDTEEQAYGYFTVLGLDHPELGEWKRMASDPRNMDIQFNPLQPTQLTSSSSKAQAVSDKIGRNDPCPCGSGKKYKKCCGK